MKKVILLMLLSQSLFAQFGQVKEYFIVSANIDPCASIKEKGIDVVLEIEYVGFIYAKMGIESFYVLQGHYRDIHGAVGVNYLSDKDRLYLGARTAKVDRGNEGAFRLNYGLEAGYQHNFGHLVVGLRTTLDKRHDQEIYDWKPQTKLSGFVTVGYKWDYNPHRR